MGHRSPDHEQLLAKGYAPVNRPHIGLVYQNPNNPNKYVECVGSSTHLYISAGSVEVVEKKQNILIHLLHKTASLLSKYYSKENRDARRRG